MKKNAKNNHAGFTLLEFIVALVVAAIMASMIYTYFGNALTQSSVPIFRLQKASNLRQVMENIVADYNRLLYLNLRYKWRSGIAYPLNSIVVPSDSTNNITSNIISNGFYYKCTTTGTSDTSNLPAWPTTTGATVNDNGIIWEAMREGGVQVWKASQAYTAGTIVIPTLNNGHYYRCETAGTSAANEPSSDNTPSNPWRLTATEGTVTDGTVSWREAGTILKSSEANIENIYTYLTTQPTRYGTGYTVVADDTEFIQFNGTTEVDAGSSGTSPEENILKVTIKNYDSAETLTQLFTIR